MTQKETENWYIGDRPSLEDYLERRAMQVSDSAANAILSQQLPNVPKVPAYKGLTGLVMGAFGYTHVLSP